VAQTVVQAVHQESNSSISASYRRFPSRQVEHFVPFRIPAMLKANTMLRTIINFFIFFSSFVC